MHGIRQYGGHCLCFGAPRSYTIDELRRDHKNRNTLARCLSPNDPHESRNSNDICRRRRSRAVFCAPGRPDRATIDQYGRGWGPMHGRRPRRRPWILDFGVAILRLSYPTSYLSRYITVQYNWVSKDLPIVSNQCRHFCTWVDKWEMHPMMSSLKRTNHLNVRIRTLSAEMANHILVLL